MILSSYRQECTCGWLFDNTGAFTRHKKTCLKGKKRLASVLTGAKELYHHKKHRIEDDEESPGPSQITSSRAVPHTADQAPNDLEPSDTPSLVDAIQLTQPKFWMKLLTGQGPRRYVCLYAYFFDLIILEPSSMVQDEDTLPLSLRRTWWTNCQLLKRFRNMLPEPPLPLPPQDVEVIQVGMPHAARELELFSLCYCYLHNSE